MSRSLLKISSPAKGMRPFLWSPNIVKVLPLPVCPYAIRVESYPSKKLSIRCLVVSAKISVCPAACVKTFSKRKDYLPMLTVWLLGKVTLIQELVIFSSCKERGLNLTKVLMRLDLLVRWVSWDGECFEVCSTD